MSSNELVKVSIVIPVFNTEKYLKQCLNSVLSQTLKEIEIICVDDGSTDDSLTILKDYSKKDSRIKIISQNNRGQGSARNKGIRLAKGEYIGFVDSDDFIDERMFEVVYNNAKKFNSDLVICPLVLMDDKSGELSYNHSYFNLDCFNNEFYNSVFSYEDTKEFIFKIGVTPHKIIKRQLFLDSSNELREDLLFPESLIFEDNAFFFKIFLNSKRCSLVQEYLYYYRINNEKSTTGKSSKKLFDVIEIYRIIKDLLIEKGLYEDEIYKSGYFHEIIPTLISKLLKIEERYQEEFYTLIKDFFKELNLFNPSFLTISDNYLNDKELTAKFLNDFKLINSNGINIDSVDINSFVSNSKFKLSIPYSNLLILFLKSDSYADWFKLNNFEDESSELKPLVSIVIPVYNVEKYIGYCLDSVISQTLNNIEILCIDDCSTDYSFKKLVEYQKKDSRIRIFKNKFNKGPGYCRNLGLNNAKGEYLAFIDSDDWIKENTYENLYTLAKNNDLDLLMFSFTLYYEDSNTYEDTIYSSLKEIDSSLDNTIFDFTEFSAANLFKINFSPINKLYKLDFLRSISVKFSEEINVAEDLLFFYTHFLKAKKVSIIRKSFYYYRIREESISTHDGNQFIDSIKAIDFLIQLFKSKNLYDKYKGDLLIFSSGIFRFNYLKLNEKDKVEYLKRIKYLFIDKLAISPGDVDVFNLNSWIFEYRSFYLAIFDAKDYDEFKIYNELYYWKLLSNNLKIENSILNKKSEDLLTVNENLNKENFKLKSIVDNVFNSNSWKLTKPLRDLNRFKK